MTVAMNAERARGLLPGSATARIARASGAATYLLLGFILLDALFEGWLRLVIAERFPDASVAGFGIDALIKGLRNAGYLGLALAGAIRVFSMGRLREFLRPVDLAFAVLIGTLLISAAAGGSSPSLTAHGIFVYLRGAIVLYAIRALAPPWGAARAFLLIAGAVITFDAVVAVAQAIAGPSLNAAFGLDNVSWAAGRANGLTTHPNQLGHLTGLAVLSLVALALPRSRRDWWLLLGVLAAGLALSQSRESLLGVAAGLVVLFFLQSGATRRVLLAAGVVAAVTGAAWTLQPGSWDALLQKINGVKTAVQVPSGERPEQTCDPAEDQCTPRGVPSRSIRVLYYQQGLRLWFQSPLVGYGVGQFGGGVASQHNPGWYLNPRFGPGGFDLQNFKVTQVDSFWLHLLVETGALGFGAYLAWLALLGLPSARRTWRSSVEAIGGRAAHLGLDRAVPPALAFAVVIAGFSPSLEDPVFPPLLLGLIGLAWVTREGATREGPAEPPARA